MPRRRQVLTVERRTSSSDDTTAVPPNSSMMVSTVSDMTDSIVRTLRTCQGVSNRELTFPEIRVPLEGMYDPPEIIGKRLKAVRLACGYKTQTEFARALGIEKNTYNPWEKGTRPLTFEGALLIRRRFKIPLDYLFFGDLADEMPAGILKRLQDAA